MVAVTQARIALPIAPMAISRKAKPLPSAGVGSLLGPAHAHATQLQRSVAVHLKTQGRGISLAMRSGLLALHKSKTVGTRFVQGQDAAGDDPYKQFLSLLLAQADLGSGAGQQDRRDELELQVEALLREHDTEIKAKAHADLQLEATDAERDAKRAAYARLMQEEGSVATTVGVLLEYFEVPSLIERIAWLVNTLVKDMQSLWAARQAAFLEILRRRLAKILSLRTILFLVDEVLGRGDKSTQAHIPGSATASRQVKKLIDMVAKPWVSAPMYQQFLTDMGKAQADRSGFRQRIKDLVMRLPLCLFDSDKARFQLCEVARDACEISVGREERQS